MKMHKNKPKDTPKPDTSAIRITVSGASSFERSHMTYIIKEILNREGFDTKFVYGVEHGTDELAFDDSMSDNIGEIYKKIVNENVIEIVEKDEKVIPKSTSICFKHNGSPASYKAFRLINQIKGPGPYTSRVGNYYGLLNGIPFMWPHHETVMTGGPKILPASHIIPLLEQLESK